MKHHKYYLQAEIEVLDAAEKKFDFIPDMSDQAAAKSLDKQCYFHTQEIAELKSRKQASEPIEYKLKEYRNYAVQHSQK